MPEPLPAALYVVATPVGNLEDITLRALRILKEVSVIACEDTRQTQKLLHHFEISTPMVSYHDFNEIKRAAELIVKLEEGEAIALVSDAGTPGISDPGYRLIQLAIRHGITVVPVPGASALLPALAASGLATDEFHFAGFLPQRRGERKTALEAVRALPFTVVFYEAPHRILETLEDIAEVMGTDRRVVIAREVTKLHEEFLRGTSKELSETLRTREGGPKGEITLLIAKAEKQSEVPAAMNVKKRLADIMSTQKLDEKAALKVLAKETGKGKSEIYRELQRNKRA